MLLLSLLLSISSPVAATAVITVQGATPDDAVWEFEVERTIGEERGTGGIILTIVPAALIDDEYNIYVLQPIDKEVRSFSWSGRPLWRAGGVGGGPGEFTAPKRMGWYSQGIYVTDGSTGRIAIFDLNGGLLRDWRPDIPVTTARRMPVPEALLADGGILFNQQRTIGAQGDSAMTEVFVFVGDSTEDVLDSLRLSRRHLRYAIRNPRQPVLGFFGGQPFADNPLLAVDPHGAFVVTAARSATADSRDEGKAPITLSRIEYGDTAWTRTYLVDAVPLSSEDREQAYAREWESVRRSRGPDLSIPDKRKALDEVLYVPEIRPPVTDLKVDSDGTIWVELAEPDPLHRTRWLLIGDKGQLRGQAVGPSGVELLDHRNGRLVAVGESPLGVPYLVLMRRRDGPGD